MDCPGQPRKKAVITRIVELSQASLRKLFPFRYAESVVLLKAPNTDQKQYYS